MFGLGVPELLFIMVLALLIFGPKRLPHIGRTLGKGMAEFRRASTELQRSMNLDLEEPTRKAVTAPPRPPAAGSEEPPAPIEPT
jgi:sec-independent protein translocase protein TatA